MKTKSQSIETRISLSLRVLCLPAIIVGLSVAAVAQEVAKSVETGLTATNAEFVKHWNQQEPAAIAAQFTSGASFVSPTGIYQGQAGVQQYYQGMFSALHPSTDFMHDIDHVNMLSDHLAIATGHWSLSRPAVKGFWSAVYEQQGDAWVMRVHTHNIAPPAPAAPGATSSNR